MTEINEILNFFKLKELNRKILKNINLQRLSREMYSDSPFYRLFKKLNESDNWAQKDYKELISLFDKSLNLIKELSKSENKNIKNYIEKLINPEGFENILIVASSRGENPGLLQKMIDSKFWDVNAKNSKGARALDYAIRGINVRSMPVLIKATDPEYLDFLIENIKKDDYKFFLEYGFSFKESNLTDQQKEERLKNIFTYFIYLFRQIFVDDRLDQ